MSLHVGEVKYFLYKSSNVCPMPDSLAQAFPSFCDYQTLVQVIPDLGVLEEHSESIYVIRDIPKYRMKTV